MNSYEESNNENKIGFFKYVFNFDETNKGILMNMFQYAFIAVPLVILVLKLMNYYTPEEDDTKGTLEIMLEVIVSISVILLSIWFINKIIRFIPNMSKLDYPLFNEVNFILPLFVVLFTMQTKLGAKINILVERLVDLYDGKTNLKDNKKKDYKTSQPISQAPGHQPSQSDFINSQTQQMPNFATNQMNNQVHSQNIIPPSMPSKQAEPTFNNAYQGNSGGGGGGGGFEPLAANEMGNMFGSMF